MDAEGRRPSRVPPLIGILLTAATIPFVWGAFAERSSHHDVHSATTAVTTPTSEVPAGTESPQKHAAESGSATTTTSASGESPAQHAAESGSATTTTSASGESPAQHAAESGSATTTTSASGETPAQHAAESGSGAAVAESGQETEFHPLGVNLESTPLVIAAALLSLLLAGVVALRPRRGVLAAVAVVAAAFTVLEVVEVAHQVSQSRPGLVALAAIAGLLHAAVVVLAASQLVMPRRVAAV